MIRPRSQAYRREIAASGRELGWEKCDRGPPAAPWGPGAAAVGSGENMRNNLCLRAGLAVGCVVVAAVAPVRAESHTTGAPVLNSNPGAAYTVYLDFGGFTFTG